MPKTQYLAIFMVMTDNRLLLPLAHVHGVNGQTVEAQEIMQERDVQVLAGHLNHVCKGIGPGR